MATSANHVISRRQKTTSLDTVEFIDTHLYIDTQTTHIDKLVECCIII